MALVALGGPVAAVVYIASLRIRIEHRPQELAAVVVARSGKTLALTSDDGDV